VPYAITNIKVAYVQDDPGVPIGFWRSVGNSQNAFVVESFIDELAAVTNQDAYHYRRDLLKDKPRHLRVLDLVAEKASWGKPLPAGRFRGMAIHESFGSVVAEVVEISIDTQKEIHVHRVVCAVDCGIAINPNIIAQQMESAVVFALTATLKSRIDIEKGRVRQRNFYDFPLLRSSETPRVETYIVQSAEPPSGIGEPGVPPLAPAVANAVFAASGVRVRSLPIKPDDLMKNA
ncbi:MAG: molybdopterin-dependent oxidoreductase, partial [Gammaproteobacteria bacterium]|nr:molybdopterin-dependent oxidoreductase [Gammaproteobacteria bacterium]